MSRDQVEPLNSSLVGPFVVMGVCGSGKSSVASLLALRADGKYLDADDFHSESNRAKMGAAIPLTDEDRWPWLDLLNSELKDRVKLAVPIFLACSALKQSYRDRLSQGLPQLRYIYLKGSQELIRERMLGRSNHFMPTGLIESQFELLEEPQEAIVADIALPIALMVENILDQIGFKEHRVFHSPR